MVFEANKAHLLDLEVERDAADAALKQLVICLKTGEERLARAQRRLDRAREDDSKLLKTSANAELKKNIKSSVMLEKADEIFQREAAQHRVLRTGDRDASVSEDYQTPPPENKHTSSPTEQVEDCEDSPGDGEAEPMSVSSSMPAMLPELGAGVFDRTTGPHSLNSAASPAPSLSEPSSGTSPEPSVVYVGPVRTSRARSIAARHRPYFRSAGNIMRRQMQQLGGEDSGSDAEESEASSERLARAARRLRERLAKSPEIEYFGETARLEHEE